jgi:lysozyme inhibitor LprI
MAKAYGALSYSLDAKQRAALAKAQGRWLTMRDDSCGDKDDGKLAARLANQNARRVSGGRRRFGGDAATVFYDPDAVGAYAEGAFTCEIAYATLRPLTKQDFPLP